MGIMIKYVSLNAVYNCTIIKRYVKMLKHQHLMMLSVLVFILQQRIKLFQKAKQ